MPLFDSTNQTVPYAITQVTDTPNPLIETDTFNMSQAKVTLEYPPSMGGGTETVLLNGPTTVQVYIPPSGQAADTDGNGLDQVPTEMTLLSLTGMSSLGPVTVTLDPYHTTTGMIEETVNNTPGTLDIPPFTATGTATSFFDVFFDVQVGGQTYHGDTSAHMQTIITHKPPAPGETYINPFSTPIYLLDANGNPTGIALVAEQHTPNPEADVVVTKTVDIPHPTVGQTIHYTVTVTNNGPQAATTVDLTDTLPSGVTLTDESATLGIVTIPVSGLLDWAVGTLDVGGTATLTITVTVNSGTAGTTQVNTASETADQFDPNTTNNTSIPATINVKATTSTSVSSSSNSSVYGQSVTFTATVTGTAFDNSGTVTFSDGSTSLGMVGLSGTTATFSTTATQLSVGTHTITASYSGDTNFTASSDSVLQTVTPAITTTTTTTVSSSSNSSVFGQSVTFTATVTPDSGIFDNSGTVTFSDGSTSLGTVELSSATATFSTTATQLSGGMHTITASYSGDMNFTSSSGSVLQTVTTASTSTSVTSSTAVSVYGQSVTFTATVAAGSVTFDNGGTVTFSDGSTLLGTVGLTGVTATFSTTATQLSGGTHTIKASYSGDTNFTNSSGSVLQTVNTASTSTSVSSSSNSSVYGQSVTFTATVAVGSLTFDNGGTVTFSDGSTSLGTVGLSGTTATFSTTATQLSGGTHTIKASYSGDTNFTTSSGSVLQTVNKAGTTTTVTTSVVPANPPGINVANVGQTVTIKAVIAGAPTIAHGDRDLPGRHYLAGHGQRQRQRPGDFHHQQPDGDAHPGRPPALAQCRLQRRFELLDRPLEHR